MITRTTGRDPVRPAVRYCCRGGQGDGELVVTRGGDGEPFIEWRAAGRSCELHADDIEVF